MSNDVNINVKSKDLTGPGTKSARKNLDGVGDSAKRVGDVAKGVLASQVFDRMGQAATRGLKSTFTAAKDLGESVNAVGKIFGDEADGVIRWGQGNAAAFGLSERAFNQAVVPMGAVLKNTGLDMGTVSDRTLTLTERAADMASVFNVDVSEALDAIQSGLKGEADPLEKFGVGLSAAAVEAEAMANRTAGATGELTDQEKMLARINLIMKQTSDVQGDFADTSDDAANAQRIASAELENAQALIGESLLPVMASLSKMVASVASGFQGLPAPIQTVVGVVGVLGAAAVIAVPKIIAAKAALAGMGVTAGGTAGKVGKAAGAIGIAATALSLLANVSKDAKVGVGEATESIVNLGKGLADTTFDDFIQDVLKAKMTAGPFRSEIDVLAEDFEAFDQALTGMVQNGNADLAAEQFEKMSDKLRSVFVSGEDIDEAFNDYRDSLAGMRAEAELGADAQGKVAGSLDGAAEAADNATDAVKDYQAALRAATDPVFNLISALDQVEDAQADYNTAVKENGKESVEARRAAIDLAKAVAGAESAAADGELSFDDFKGKLREWVRQGAITENQAKQIAGRVRDARGAAKEFEGSYKARLAAQVDRASLNNANATLNDVARDRVAIIRAHAVAGSNPSIGALMQAQGGITGVSHAAEGGPRGNRVLVGERGPEIVDLAPGSMVHPAGTTQAMLAGGGGGDTYNITLNAPNYVGDKRELIQALREEIRNLGGNVQGALGQRQ